MLPICRSMVEPLFTREHIETMRPHIQETVDSLLKALIKNGCEKPVDLVEKFSLPVPSYVSFAILVHGELEILVLRSGVARKRSSTGSSEFQLMTLNISPNAMPSDLMAAQPRLLQATPTSMCSLLFHSSCCGMANWKVVMTFRELLDYMGKLVDKRVIKPENDLISKLVVEQVRPTSLMPRVCLDAHN